MEKAGVFVNVIVSVLVQRTRGRLDTQRRRQCEDRAKCWRDVAVSQAMRAAARSWKRQGMDSPLEPLAEVYSANTLERILDFCEIIITRSYHPEPGTPSLCGYSKET